MVTQNITNCTGCGVCAAICPRECLSMCLNSDGFYVPQMIAEGICVNCGLCDRICAKDGQVEEQIPLITLSAVAKDENVLATTSSGGLCYEIARYGLENEMQVCGCIYDYHQHRAIHTVVTDLQSLEATKGSKYFQSYTREAFSKVLDGNRWMVFGTPCQIASIANVAEHKKIRDKLILVDFFCHGTPSMNLWKKYLQEHDEANISRIDFRSKEFGWGSFSLRFTYTDGNQISDYHGNMFYNFFFGNLCLNTCCYECKFKGVKSKADIRVGDYWGDKYKDNKTGVSCCVVLTQYGQEVMEHLKNRCLLCPEEIESVLKAQMTESPKLNCTERTKLLRAFQGKRSLRTIFDTTLLTYRIKCKLQSIIRGR